MSYYTEVQVSHWGDDSVSVDLLLEAAQECVCECGCYAEEDVLADLREALSSKTASFSDLRDSDFEMLFRMLSRRAPKVVFQVRGWGEEFEDVWLREFRGGELVFKRGPFEREPDKAGDTC